MSIALADLVKARVHFGHRTTRWNPKMAPYLWGHKNGVHLIDVAKTAHLLERAAQFLESVAAEGKTVLWVGTKKPAQDAVKAAGATSRSPHVTHRWVGGTLTNYSQVKKSVTKMLHLEDVVEKSSDYGYTKKELNRFQKLIGRLQSNVGGIRRLPWPVCALVVVDVCKEQAAIREARRSGVPVIGIVDTNGDPSQIDYVIPANDDAVSSITLITDYLAQAIARGQARAGVVPSEEVSIEVAIEPQGLLALTEEETVPGIAAKARPLAPAKPKMPARNDKRPVASRPPVKK